MTKYVWVTLVFGLLVAANANAESIIGKLYANESSLINPGSNSHRVGSEEVPYISGDVISTKGSQEARLLLNTSDLKFTLARDSVASIDHDAITRLVIEEGAVGIEIPAGLSLDIESATQNTRISADSAAIAIVVYDNDELSIATRRGNITVRNGDAFSSLDSDEAITYGQGLRPRLVNVQTFSNSSGGKNNKLIWWLLGGAAGAWALYELLDDDDPAPEPPTASPAG